MTIHLPPELESSIQAAVHRGHFASVDAAMTKAASLLLQQLKQEQAEWTAHTNALKELTDAMKGFRPAPGAPEPVGGARGLPGLGGGPVAGGGMPINHPSRGLPQNSPARGGPGS